MAGVLIRGDGIASSCCARLFGEAGVPFALETYGRPKLPAVMLGEAAQKLLQDVFCSEDLCVGLPRIRKRIVAWKPGSKPLTLPHSAVVVSEQELLRRIRLYDRSDAGYERRPHPDWTVFASAPLSADSIEQHFGSRYAAASATRLQSGCDTEACWIESVENGWMFLLPNGDGHAWLLSVGESVGTLVDQSRLIREQISELDPAGGRFPSHPRIAWPLSGSQWIACGTAALGFDPLCGDGVGNAIREAILGAAVVRAALAGGDAESLRLHYQSRLLAGFHRHLGQCLEFYGSGRWGSWWDDQLALLQCGMEWCSAQFTSAVAPRYRLNGFTLEPVS